MGRPRVPYFHAAPGGVHGRRGPRRDGGYLDTNDVSDQDGGAKYAVSTSPYSDRGTGTGSWKVLPAT
ncbi:hypothetical protein [Streptomyces misionensis]|uniref:hypothetical protein n=1 Tax=Streptomyces misionensis TaxID=67331 RepID=UPI0036CE116D